MDPAGEIANAEGIMINVYVIWESSKEKDVDKNSMAMIAKTLDLYGYRLYPINTSNNTETPGTVMWLNRSAYASDFEYLQQVDKCLKKCDFALHIRDANADDTTSYLVSQIIQIARSISLPLYTYTPNLLSSNDIAGILKEEPENNKKEKKSKIYIICQDLYPYELDFGQVSKYVTKKLDLKNATCIRANQDAKTPPHQRIPNLMNCIDEADKVCILDIAGKDTSMFQTIEMQYAILTRKPVENIFTTVEFINAF